MFRQPPTLDIQPTPKHREDDPDHDEVLNDDEIHNYDGVLDDDHDSNLIGESGVEIRNLGDHQQPRGGTLLFPLLLLLVGLLVITSVLMVPNVVVVVVVIVEILVVVAVIVVVTTVTLGIEIVAQLKPQPDGGKSVLAALNKHS